MRRMVVEAAALGLQQRQLADYQCTVSSLTRRLDDVNALLREARQQLRDSGAHWPIFGIDVVAEGGRGRQAEEGG